MPLDEYERKRDFARTPEPAGPKRSGRKHAGGGGTFVVHKHDSRRLHYDLRLELDGALLSWAIPKGPSLDPGEKHLAVRVEDHPLEYGGFEGVIPKGEYGAGTVMLWDRGTWEPAGDPREGLARGDLKFTLRGEKLHGEWVLAKMKRRGEEDKENWLLIKHRDAEARPGDGGALLAEQDRSVVSGRSMPEIAAEAASVWHSDAPADAQTQVRPAEEARLDLSALPGAVRAEMPGFAEPQLALLVKSAPAGDEWLHEIKFDGYRAISRIERGEVGMYSRRANDWTAQFRSVADELARLAVDEAMLDGEICVTTPDGVTSFGMLQYDLSVGSKDRLLYFAFDLLFLNGYDLRGVPLAERKRVLRRVLAPLGSSSRVRYTEDVAGHGPEVYANACKLGLEGAIAKRAASLYRSGSRNPDWVKVKCIQRQEFVIGGWTDPSGSRTGFGALLLGVNEPGGGLRYSGKVGTGFSDKLLEDLGERLREMQAPDPPFTANTDLLPKRAHWVRPELVAEVAFAEKTSVGQLRHPSFEGLRADKPASEVIAEEPVATPTAAEGEASVLGVRLTHPDRVFYPDDGVTKLRLAEYYVSVADWMLPHIAHRPLALVRCPDGIGDAGGGPRAGGGVPCFFHKHAGGDFPQPLERLTIRESEGPVPYLAVTEAASLVALAQMGTLEIHMWGSRAPDVEHPDYMVFDLDPSPDVTWEAVNDGARLVRDLLAGLGLVSFVKTTGGKGLHVCVPLLPRTDWNGVKDFAEALARAIAHYEPAKYVATMSKAKREGRVFVDYLRNARSNTSIAPFSTRARPHATVSVPLRWDELSPKRHSDGYTVANLGRRLSRLSRDPWEGYFEVEQTITPKMRREIGLD